MTFVIIALTAFVSIGCFSNRALFEKLALSPYMVKHRKEWYRMITHMFVHGNWAHLLVNMFVLWSFGGWIYSKFTTMQDVGMLWNANLTFLLLYLLGGVAASVQDLIKQKDNPYYSSIGASGAVSAIVFASIFFDPWSKIYLFGVIGIPGIVFGILYLLYSRYMGGRGGDNVNHYAHLYGALFGFIFPLFISPSLINEFLTELTSIF